MPSKIAVALALVPLAASCAGAALESPWRSEVALDVGTKLGGCAVGELLPDRPGAEIAVVAGTGQAFVVHRAEGGEAWASERVASLPGEMIQCAIGDLVAERAGAELALVGMKQGSEDDGGAGAAYVAWRSADGWRCELVFEDAALIHGVCAADLMPERAGDELLLVGFSREAHVAWREGGAWRVEPAGRLPGPGKNAVPFRGGAAVACADGTVVHVVRRDGAWAADAIDRIDAGRARLASDGERLLVASDDGGLDLLTPGPDGWRRERLHRSQSKLRGAVLADLDPDVPGVEAATAGYDQRLLVLTHRGEAWLAETAYEDDARFHHLAAGDVLPDVPGLELASCGYSGRVVVVHRAP